MNRFPAALLTVLTLALPPVVLAQGGGMMAHHEGNAPRMTQDAMTRGIVKRVDATAGSVTIAHGPVANLRMPGMTMTFLVKDRTWLDGLKEGTPVRFVAQNVNGALTIVSMRQEP